MDRDVIAEFLELVPADVATDSKQLNITTETATDVLNAFRGLAWIHRVTHGEMLRMMVTAEIDFLDSTGKLELERQNQASQAVRQARRDERIV